MISRGCWDSVVTQDFGAGVLLCVYPHLGRVCELGLFYLLKFGRMPWLSSLLSFSLVKNVERRSLGEENKKKRKCNSFFLLPKNVDGIGDIQWESIDYTLSLLLAFFKMSDVDSKSGRS